MSDSFLAGLTGAALVLPLALAGVAHLIERHPNNDTTLGVKIGIVLAWVVAIGVWFGFFAYATGRVENSMSEENIIICWVVAIVIQLVSLGGLYDAYD
jgi:hypothetical protein